MGKVPFPPFEKRLLPAKYGAGMDYGKTTRTGNTVWHTMVGTLTGTDAYFRLNWVHAATHWGIGGSLDNELDGTIYQWVEIGSNNVPWASGPWRHPGYGDGLRYVNEWDVYGINAKAESIEFSGMVETPMTMRQWQKGIWLTAAVAHAAGRDSEEFLWNMHHEEFCQPSYKKCPFERITRYTVEYQTGIVKLMQFFEGKRMPDEAVRIAGIWVPLPLEAKPGPSKPGPDKPIFQSFPKPRKAVLWSATARQYGNTDATIYEHIPEGETRWFDGYYHGQTVKGDDRWYVVDSDRRERIHSSGIKTWLGDEPEPSTDKERELFSQFSNAAGIGPHWVR